VHDPFDFDAGPAGAELAWRETYVVLFPASERPTLTQVEAAIGDAGGSLRIEKLRADDDGLFRSALVQAPEDNAALDLRYEASPAVAERAVTLAEQLRTSLKPAQLERLLEADAWLEVMHFERVEPLDDPDAEPEDDLLGPGGLDPSTLITVVEALAHLTDGLPIDPEAGELLS